MIKELARLASHLDNKGRRKEADYLDKIIKKMAGPEEASEAPSRFVMVSEINTNLSLLLNVAKSDPKALSDGQVTELYSRLNMVISSLPEEVKNEFGIDEKWSYTRDNSTTRTDVWRPDADGAAHARETDLDFDWDAGDEYKEDEHKEDEPKEEAPKHDVPDYNGMEWTGMGGDRSR